MSVTTYIQGHDASTLKSHQSRTAEKQAGYLTPLIQASDRILDVGCGPGTITCDFTKYAPDGEVVGVDYSAEVLEQARAEATRRGLKNIVFHVSSAHELPFADDSFDIVHCHAVLIHLPDAPAALKEMWRVCRRGGIVACREPDWSTCVIYPYSEELERWKSTHMKLKRREGAEADAGRHLAAWAGAAGFDSNQVTVTSDVLQYFGKEEVKWWGELYADRMGKEFGKRAVESGLVTAEDVKSFAAAYLAWSKSEFGIWAMIHMKMIARK